MILSVNLFLQYKREFKNENVYFVRKKSGAANKQRERRGFKENYP